MKCYNRDGIVAYVEVVEGFAYCYCCANGRYYWVRLTLVGEGNITYNVWIPLWAGEVTIGCSVINNREFSVFEKVIIPYDNSVVWVDCCDVWQYLHNTCLDSFPLEIVEAFDKIEKFDVRWKLCEVFGI